MHGAAPPPRSTAEHGQRYAVSMVDQHQPGGAKYFDRSKPPQVRVYGSISYFIYSTLNS